MPKRPAPSPGSAFTIGRAAFDRISAVEGLHRDAASQAMFEDFDRRGLSPDERRREIQARHGVTLTKHAQDGRFVETGPAGPSRRRQTAG